MTRWSHIAVTFWLTLLGLFGLAQCVRSHEAPSGFQYDNWCCSKGDCSPLAAARLDPTLKAWVYKNQQGSEAPVRPNVTRFLPSPDGETHVCIPANDQAHGGGPVLRCIYMPPGG